MTLKSLYDLLIKSYEQFVFFWSGQFLKPSTNTENGIKIEHEISSNSSIRANSRGAPADRHLGFRTNDNSQWAPAASDPCSQTDADSRCALALDPFGVQQMPYTSSARSARVAPSTDFEPVVRNIQFLIFSRAPFWFSWLQFKYVKFSLKFYWNFI